MSIIVAKDHEISKKSLSSVYTDFLNENLAKNKRLVHVEADLGVALFGNEALDVLAKRYPDRFINTGIEEANAVGVACGLSAVGMIPFAHSFGAFAARRAADQIFVSGAYAHANVRVIGTDPGIMAGYNGGTHMVFEDVAIMRSYPTMTVLEPTDNVLAKYVFEETARREGMFYIRLTRGAVPKIYEEGSTFEIGKGNVLRDGKDVTLIAAGILVPEALGAAELLAQEGIQARVIDMFTIKPLDEELVLRSAKETGAIVTCENNNVCGGLGEAVAALLARSLPTPMELVGVQDRFGQVGSNEYLKEAYGLTAANIAAQARKALARK